MRAIPSIFVPVAMVVAMTTLALCQTDTGQLDQCVPPERPLLDEASLQILGITIGQEISRYVDQAQRYSLCLDATKQRLFDEVNGYLEQYRQEMNP